MEQALVTQNTLFLGASYFCDVIITMGLHYDVHFVTEGWAVPSSCQITMQDI